MAPTTACGTSAIRRWLPCLVVALFITTLAQQADADFTITNATIAQGDLWVAGQIDEPNTPITLDDSYTEKTDRNGRFEFRAAYHPATCSVVLKTDRQSRAVVIANCGQRGPAGPPGPPGNATPGYAPPQEPAPAGTSGGVMCGTQAALYQTESGSKVWITRKGRLAQEDPLRPLSSHAPGLVLQATIEGRTVTAYGPDFTHMVRGGSAQELEDKSGRPIAWDAQMDGLPRELGTVPAEGSSVVTRLSFRQCGKPPGRGREAAPKPKRKGAGTTAPTAGSAPASPGGLVIPKDLPVPQGALQERSQ